MESRTFIKPYLITYNFIWVCSGKSRKGRMKCLEAITQSENQRLCRKQTKKTNTPADLCCWCCVSFLPSCTDMQRCFCVLLFDTRKHAFASLLCHFKVLCHLLHRIIWLSGDRRMSCCGGVKDKGFSRVHPQLWQWNAEIKMTGLNIH